MRSSSTSRHVGWAWIPSSCDAGTCCSRDELPYANPNGMPYSDITPTRDVRAGARRCSTTKRSAVSKPRHELRAATSASVRPPTWSRPRRAWPSTATEGATIRIEPSGKVNVYVAGGSTGNSLETAAVQLTADALGVDIADVRTIQGDTAVTPFGAGTGGSRSGSMIAGAITETASVLRERLIAIAAHRLEAAPADIVLDRSQAARAGDAEHLGLAGRAGRRRVLPTGHSARGRASRAWRPAPATRPKAPMIWANATHVCTCEVDIVTGAVRLLRYIVSEDCGPMINPNVVEGQIAGGTVQGIGGVLLEHLAYDPDGNPLTTTFMDYLLPTAADVPLIEYGHVETMAPGPGGYKGVGEGGAIGAPPAVVNAVADALGAVRRRDHPPAAHAGGDRRPPGGGPMKPAPVRVPPPDDCRRGRLDARRAWATPASSSPAARASSRCWPCDWRPSSISSTSAASTSSAASTAATARVRIGADDHPGDDRAVRRGRRLGPAARSGHAPTSVTSRSATEAPSADPSPTPTRRRSTRPWPWHSTPSSSSCRPTGRRTVPAADFFTGLWTTALADDELLVAVSFPVWTGRCGFAVRELARRHGDFAIAGAAVAVELDDEDRVKRCSIALLGLGSTARAGRCRPRRRPPATPLDAIDPDRDRSAGGGGRSTPSRRTCTARPTTGAGSAPRMTAARVAGRDRGGPPWVRWRSRSRVNGDDPQRSSTTTAHACGLPPRAVRPDRHPPRL